MQYQVIAETLLLRKLLCNALLYGLSCASLFGWCQEMINWSDMETCHEACVCKPYMWLGKNNFELISIINIFVPLKITAMYNKFMQGLL